MSFNKKGQEEMIGFIIVVVLVIIVGVIFLGIFLRSPATNFEQESQDIYQFLEAGMEHTSDCSIKAPALLNVNSLLQECNKGSICLNGQSSCDALSSTVESLLLSSYQVSEDSVIKGYLLTSFRDDTPAIAPLMLKLESGNCNNSSSTRSAEFPSPNRIRTTLKLCF